MGADKMELFLCTSFSDQLSLSEAVYLLYSHSIFEGLGLMFGSGHV